MAKPKIKLVIAGNFSQYMEWLERNGATEQSARYVCSAHHLRGMRGCEVVRTGEYWRNPANTDPYLMQVEMGNR